jgi:uncharacterized protein
MVKAHPGYHSGTVELQVVSNGTLVTDEILDFMLSEDISFGISCDGIPPNQDRCRRFKGGSGSSAVVEDGIRRAILRVPGLMVNAVYDPSTVDSLDESVSYFYRLGLRSIYLNPDFSASWSLEDSGRAAAAYQRVRDLYIGYHISGDPAYISLIDGKIAVIVNGGYSADARCTMGRKELAFTPEGRIYPCERLVGDGLDGEHCIGDVWMGIDPARMECTRRSHSGSPPDCVSCTANTLCMHWCGCSNFFSSGRYGAPGPFLCASERASIKNALEAFQILSERLGSSFLCQTQKKLPCASRLPDEGDLTVLQG